MADVKRRWPWQAKVPSRPEVGHQVVDRNSDAGEEEQNETAPQAPSRWVQGAATDLSPYGFADEDGGLRQVESNTWKRAFTGHDVSAPHTDPRRSTGCFVPRTGTGPGPDRRAPQRGKFGSSLVWQTFCAALLVGIGYFVQHTDQPAAQSAVAKTQGVFDTDYTNEVEPVIATAFADLHLKIPSFGVSASRLHVPVKGSIVDDFSKNHPEIWLSASASAPVMATGSGTVTAVVKSGDTELIKIDNGQYGTSIYAGVGKSTVKANQYVSAGEIIGTMPTSPSHPTLRFSLVKDGSYENPHNYIQFGDGFSS